MEDSRASGRRRHGETSPRGPLSLTKPGQRPQRPTAKAYVRAALQKTPYDPLPGWCGPFWTVLIILGAVGRGSDLILAPNESRSELATWVNVIGYNTYGAMFLLAAGILILTKIIRRVGPFVIGLSLVAAVNFMYAIALSQGVFFSPGPTTGWRFVTPPLLSTVLCIGRIITLRGVVRRVAG